MTKYTITLINHGTGQKWFIYISKSLKEARKINKLVCQTMGFCRPLDTDYQVLFEKKEG